MALVDQAREFLSAREYAVEERDKDFLVATQPGLGGSTERTCVWVLTRESRATRQQPFLEDEYTTRFRGAVSKYRGARLYLLVDSLEGFSAEFRSQALREYGVQIRVPAWFFDMPFKYETARSSVSIVKDLADEAEANRNRRVPQAYVREDDQTRGDDLVPDLLKEIEANNASQEAHLWLVVAPAGQGKSILFSALFGHLYERFQNFKAAHMVYPRPMPLLPAHLREAAAANTVGLIDAFLRTDVASPTTRKHFDWLIGNRFALWMLDGLDEVLAGDDSFFAYLEDRITAPGGRPAVVICVRDSLLVTSDQLVDFVDYYRSVISILRLEPWGAEAKRAYAWLGLVGRLPRAGDKSPDTVGSFLGMLRRSRELDALASLPFYTGVLTRAFKEDCGITDGDELSVLELAVTQMCRREYGKGVLDERTVPLNLFREWLEELAVLIYEQRGVPIQDFRSLAAVLPFFAGRTLTEEEERRLIEQITMAPFVKKSAVSGRLEFAHEILSGYLAGSYLAREMEARPTRFVSRLSGRPWPSDSIMLRVLARNSLRSVEILVASAAAEGLTGEALRNLVQLVAMVPGGDRLLRERPSFLDGARLEGVCFRGVDLDGVSFRGCNLTNVEFQKCKLRNTRFEGALLKGTRFSNLDDGALRGVSFGDCEHFESAIVNGKHISDNEGFGQWVARETGARIERPGPCDSALQLLFVFRKFVHLDGQPRRDSLGLRGLMRGRQYGAVGSDECVEKAIELGYLERSAFDLIRRPSGPKYGEVVSFVKSRTVSPGLRSLLDLLCRIPECGHVVAAGATSG